MVYDSCWLLSGYLPIVGISKTVSREAAMAKSVHLTKRKIDSFTYEGGTDYRWDRDLRGFGVRIHKSGLKAFVIGYRSAGRKRIMVIGRYGTLTLDEARTKARRELGKVADGIDPAEERRKAAQAKTFAELTEKYLKEHAKPHNKTWKADKARLERHIPKSWRNRKVTSITREEVAALHSKIGAQYPYEANRLLAQLHLMFKLARIWHFVEPRTDNPAEGIRRFKEKKRKRWVTPEELPRLAKAIDAEPNIYVRAVLWLYLLTGARKTELLNARWDDVDWDRGTLRLPDT